MSTYKEISELEEYFKNPKSIPEINLITLKEFSKFENRLIRNRIKEFKENPSSFYEFVNETESIDINSGKFVSDLYKYGKLMYLKQKQEKTSNSNKSLDDII